METLYDVLNCDETASYDEIKRNYQRLIRLKHPDKGDETSCDNFVKINRAWQTLKDESSRKQYDAVLLKSRFDGKSLVYAEVAVDDLKFDCNDTAFYQCRCGSDIPIEKQIVREETETLFECSECSNCILILNKNKES